MNRDTKYVCYAKSDHLPTPAWAVAIALVYVPTPDGNIMQYVCKEHLDHWLDMADDQPEWEPSAIVWMV